MKNSKLFLAWLFLFSIGPALLAEELPDWRCTAEIANHGNLNSLFNDPSWQVWQSKLAGRAEAEKFSGPRRSNLSAALTAFPEIEEEAAIALLPFFWVSSFGTRSKNYTGRWAIQPKGGDAREWNRLSVTLINSPLSSTEVTDRKIREVRLAISLLRRENIGKSYNPYAVVKKIAEESGLDPKALIFDERSDPGEYRDYRLNIEALPLAVATFIFIGKVQQAFVETAGGFLLLPGTSSPAP